MLLIRSIFLEKGNKTKIISLIVSEQSTQQLLYVSHNVHVSIFMVLYVNCRPGYLGIVKYLVLRPKKKFEVLNKYFVSVILNL